jgi:hypothetical protein
MTVEPGKRLKQVLPHKSMTDAVKDDVEGRPWFRADKLASMEGVSTSTIYTHIREDKLEGCLICGVVHARKPIGQGGLKNAGAAAKEPGGRA